jgi:hypothetical protein
VGVSQASEFFPIQPVTPDVQEGARFSSQREVQPLIDRPAPLLWRSLFHNACEASPDLDWKGAGFVYCSPDEVARVTDRLADITASTNAAFATHLAEASPDELARLMEEGINHLGEPGGAYMIPFA